MIDFQMFSNGLVLLGLIVTVAFVVLIPDWRLALYALAAQYIIVAAVLLAQVPWQLAVVRVISGAIALMILYWTAREKLDEYHRALRSAPDAVARMDLADRYRHSVFVVGFSFRLFALALVVAGILGLVSSMSFLELTPDELFGSLWLITSGMLVSILSRDVLRFGLGILIFTSGFTLLETAVESSLLLYGLLNISDLLIALVIAHLGALPLSDLTERRGELH